MQSNGKMNIEKQNDCEINGFPFCLCVMNRDVYEQHINLILSMNYPLFANT